MLREIKGDRQRDERIDIFPSPLGSLWEEGNYFKAAALMKEKGVMSDVFLQRWNQQYEWLKGRERGRERTFVSENLMGGFGWEKRVLFDSSEQHSDSPVRTCDWLDNVIFGVYIKKKCSRCYQIVSSFAESVWAFASWAASRCVLKNMSWKWNSCANIPLVSLTSTLREKQHGHPPDGAVKASSSTILVTHKANRNETVVSEKTHGVMETPGAGWIT